MIRLNKYIANCGICSRRKADEYIAQGLVKVNGRVVKELGTKISEEEDIITFKGKTLRKERKKVYVLMNKPKNTITTMRDEKNRKTVMDIIGDRITERIYPVGRLDKDTVGLLLLTNDGNLTKKLSHPSHNVKKIYHVVLNKPILQKHMDTIAKGIELEDGIALVDKVRYIDDAPKTEVAIEIHMGKNRIVRRIFEHFDYTVIRLDRIYYGGLTKKDLPRGRYRHLTKQEVIMLKHFA